MTAVPVPDSKAGVASQTPAAERYLPSGRVDWPVFLGLAVAAFGVAGGMAYLLYLVEFAPYIVVVTPAVLGIPVFAALVAAIYLGKCRSVAWAGVLAAALAVAYYAGYWVLSYQLRVVSAGPRFAAAVAEQGGAPGLAGYFIFRCRVAPLAFGLESFAWAVVAMALRGLEFGFLLAMALYGARRLAGRVFYEEYGRWASSNSFLFLARDLPAVLDAIESQDWGRLDGVEKRTPTREQRRQGGMIFRAEFLPGVGDLPVYVTVEGPRLRRLPWLLQAAPVLGRLVTRAVEQRRVPPASARELAGRVGMIDLGGTGEAAAGPAAGEESIGYWSGEQRVAGSPHGGMLTSMFREVGIVGATFVGAGPADFRDRASAVSLAAIGSSPDAGVEGVYDSLCYRADPRPLQLLKRLSRVDVGATWTFLICSLLGAVISVLGPALAFAWDPRVLPFAWAAMFGVWFIGAGAFAFMMIGMTPYLRWRLRRHFRSRPGSLLLRRDEPDAPLPAARLVRVEDPATYHVSKLTPEDWGLCVLDGARRQLLLEGVSHRYVVHGRDVKALVPLVSGASESVRIDCRVAGGAAGGEDFSFVINRYANAAVLLYAISTFPVMNLLLGPVVRRGSARFAAKVGRALGVSVQPGPVAATPAPVARPAPGT